MTSSAGGLGGPGSLNMDGASFNVTCGTLVSNLYLTGSGAFVGTNNFISAP